MKFKKDGKVFEDISKAWFAWKCPNPMCRMRPSDDTCQLIGTVCSLEWCKHHPAEAARLMGYEVVEESIVALNAGKDESSEANMDKQKPIKDWTMGEVQEYCSRIDLCHKSGCLFRNGSIGGVTQCFFDLTPTRWDLTEKPRFMPEEVVEDKEDKPMEKPRICEVLGVEPGEYFWIEQDNRKWCASEKGENIISSNGEVMPGEYLCSIINMPKLIIRKPRFTEEEVADARAIVRLFSRELWTTIKRCVDDTLWVQGNGGAFMNINNERFKSLLPGDSVKLSDIMGGAT